MGGEVESLETPSAPRPARGTETIVLVEDDKAVRFLAALLLRRQGYTVHSFGDPLRALEAVERMDPPVHLLVTDVVMPKMNGQALATRFTALRPNARVLYTSGYTVNVIVHHGVLKEGSSSSPSRTLSKTSRAAYARRSTSRRSATRGRCFGANRLNGTGPP